MGTVGREELIRKHGSRLEVAEALIMGKISSHEQEFIGEIVSPVILEAARIRLEANGLLTPEHVSGVTKKKK